MSEHRTVSIILATWLCVLGLGCVSNREQLSRNCAEQIWAMKSSRIVQLLGPKGVVSVKTVAVWRDDGLYVLFFDESETKVVAFDLGDGKPLLIRNMGFADRAGERDWRLLHTQDEGTDVELNGGVGTIHAMLDAI